MLGSRGSVLPLLRQQIAPGGPVSLTHPEMRRYFMTIPEAVQLVLQAAVIGQPGRTYVLDMGKPVRLVDLVQDLIELSGLQLGRDITFTGPRPGEKLFEELFGGAERHSRTDHAKIFVALNGYHRNGHDTGAVGLHERAKRLIAAAQAGCPDAVRGWLQRIVPEYQPAQWPVAEAAAVAAPAPEPLAPSALEDAAEQLLAAAAQPRRPQALIPLRAPSGD